MTEQQDALSQFLNDQFSPNTDAAALQRDLLNDVLGTDFGVDLDAGGTDPVDNDTTDGGVEAFTSDAGTFGNTAVEAFTSDDGSFAGQGNDPVTQPNAPVSLLGAGPLSSGPAPSEPNSLGDETSETDFLVSGNEPFLEDGEGDSLFELVADDEKPLVKDATIEATEHAMTELLLAQQDPELYQLVMETRRVLQAPVPDMAVLHASLGALQTYSESPTVHAGTLSMVEALIESIKEALAASEPPAPASLEGSAQPGA